MSRSNHNETKPTATSLSASDIVKASQNSETNSQCRSCVDMLRQVLQSADSKPSQLLASLFADSTTTNSSSTAPLRWRQATNGIEVQIPQAAVDAPLNAVPRRLSRLHPPELDEVQADSTMTALRPASLFTAGQQLATSATPPTATASNHPLSAVDNHSTVKTEWLSIRCQPCKMTGPEGGARAFVMGPTPLSVVVCTNRLKHLHTASSNSHSVLSSSSSTAAAAAAARNEMEEILTHELVHVYDVRQLQLDLRDCQSLAYSEVRAAREAECRNYYDAADAALSSPPQPPAWYTLGMSSSSAPTRRSCASHTAQTATNNLFPNRNMAQKCVQTVFERAFNDTRPFPRPRPPKQPQP